MIMLHPDYQYSPKLVTSLAGMTGSGHYDVALGSRILGIGALKGGMPLYKFISNRFLTAIQNLLLGYELSEYHTGFRAFSRQVLESLPVEKKAMIFYSITKYSPKQFILIIRSAKFRAQRSILLKRPRSVSHGA